MSELLIFAGGTVITPGLEIKGDLVVEGGKVKEIRKPGTAKPNGKIIDCCGMYVGPGLVDIHVHGGGGHELVTIDPGEIIKGAEYHLSQGVTSLVPSSISVPFDEMELGIKACMTAAKSCKANILGYHIEGVYLDQQYRGGHLSEFVHNPDRREYMPFIEKYGDFIREWTLAPELPGAIELIGACRQARIVTSAGHTQASYEKMMEAIDAGLSHSTHFVCVMGSYSFSPLRELPAKGYRPGAVETILLNDGITTEVIADGYHLHPAIIKLALKCKGPMGVCLVSDAMKGAGLDDSEYTIGGQECVVKDGIAFIKSRPEVIASSVTSLIGMFRFAHNVVGISLSDTWTMASFAPAKVIGVDKAKGSLSPGKDADILVLKKDLTIDSVYVGGKKA